MFEECKKRVRNAISRYSRGVKMEKISRGSAPDNAGGLTAPPAVCRRHFVPSFSKPRYTRAIKLLYMPQKKNDFFQEIPKCQSNILDKCNKCIKKDKCIHH